jgi:hypothetical protein
VKVDKQKFENVVRALLNTPPMPLAEIPRKRAAKVATRSTSKKHN